MHLTIQQTIVNILMYVNNTDKRTETMLQSIHFLI